MSAKTYPVDAEAFAGWDGTIAGARALQRELAGQVRLDDALGTPRLYAGLDVGFEQDGTITRAAAVLLDAQTLALLAEAVVRRPTTMPYVPGLLSFRELPALLQALRELPEQPDLVFVDGHGIAHPRRLGIAAHLGVVSGLPTIGVGKSVLTGEHAPLAAERGAQVPLLDGGERIGIVLRTRERVAPLIVSPGHRIGFETAAARVLAALTRYRLPEPTRLADRLASQRVTRAAARRRAPGAERGG